MRVLKFQQYNEEWFWGREKKPYESKLQKYNITYKQENEHMMNFYHSGKLIANLQLNQQKSISRAVWTLTIYLYDSESPKPANHQGKEIEIKGQREKPYDTTTRDFTTDSESVVLNMLKWWETYTKSGRKKNLNFTL